MKNINYFMLASNHDDYIKFGSRVFIDKENVFSKNTLYTNYLYTYIANYDLLKLENILAHRGYKSIDICDVPKELRSTIEVIICDKNFDHVRRQLDNYEVSKSR